jgi:hypothetical protein
MLEELACSRLHQIRTIIQSIQRKPCILFNFSDDLKPLPKNASSNSKLVNEQVVNKSCTSDETSAEQVSEQVLVPYINNTNIPNDSNNRKIVNESEQAKKIEENRNEEFVIPSAVEVTPVEKEKKLREKKKDEKPTIENVKAYFLEQNFPELEAQKFFNYFSSIGWLVGGKTPMIDWQAAAQNWIINSVNFNHNTDTAPPNRPKHLNTTTDKNYAEPL